MAASGLRCGWRRLLSQAASGVQAELQRTVAAPPAALPSLLTCMRRVSIGTGPPAAPAAGTGLAHCRFYASPATAAANAPADAPAVAATVAQRLPHDAAQLRDGGVSASGGLQDREVPLRTWAGDAAGTAVLPGAVFDVDVRKDILHRVVRWQLAKRQQGTHKAKTRREVRGGGRKPHAQKGSGRARAGTIRAPQWRGGGKAHGPVPRSHEHDLQRKVRQMGLRCALSAKASEGRLIVMDTLALSEPKTKGLDGALNVLLAEAPRRSALIMDSAKDGADGGDNLRLAAGNLPWVDVLPVAGANVYSILQRDYLLISRAALDGLTERCTRAIRRRPLSATAPLPGAVSSDAVAAAAVA